MSAAPRTSNARVACVEFKTVATLLRRAGCRFESEVIGSSMSPTIPDGARIRIGPPPGGDYRVGDIVTCVVGESLFTHRIVYRNIATGTVLTRGDGWILCDPPTPPERVVGAVAEYSRDGTWLAPGPAPQRRWWGAALAAVSYWLVRGSLPIHPEVSRRVSGTMLGLGALSKSLARRWPGGGPSAIRDR